jgi:hypothetical protein
MPAVPRQESPAANRYSRTQASAKVPVTISTAGLATFASGALDGFQSGDLALLVETTPGTAMTGGTGGTTPLDKTSLYAIEKVSATTARLYKGSLQGTLVSNLGVALSAGASLQFGDPLNSDLVARNIVPMGSVAGGSQAGPLD